MLDVYQIAAGPFHTLMLTAVGQLYVMGNSKDGKLGVETGNVIMDIELPIQIKKGPKDYFQNQTVKPELKQYPLFDEYDQFNKLKPIIMKDKWGEIN